MFKFLFEVKFIGFVEAPVGVLILILDHYHPRFLIKYVLIKKKCGAALLKLQGYHIFQTLW